MKLTSLPDTTLSYIYLFLTHKEIVRLTKLDERFAQVQNKYAASVRPPDSEYALQLADMEENLRSKLFYREKLTPDEHDWLIPPTGFQIDSLKLVHTRVIGESEASMEARFEENRTWKVGRFCIVLYAVGEEVIQRLYCRKNKMKYVRVLVTIGRDDINPTMIFKFANIAIKLIGERAYMEDIDPNFTWIGIVGGVFSKIVSEAIQAGREEEDFKQQLGEDETTKISIENLKFAIRKCFPQKMKPFGDHLSQQIKRTTMKEGEKLTWKPEELMAFLRQNLACCLVNHDEEDLHVRSVLCQFLTFVAHDILNLVGKEAIVAKIRSGIACFSENPFHRVLEDPQYREMAQYHLIASKIENANWLRNVDLLGIVKKEMDGRYKIVTEPFPIAFTRLQMGKTELIVRAHSEHTHNIEGVFVVDEDVVHDQVRLSLLETINGAKLKSIFQSCLGPPTYKMIHQELDVNFDFEMGKWRFQNAILRVSGTEKENKLFYNNLETLFTRCVPYFECVAMYDMHERVSKIKPCSLKGRTLRVFCEIVDSSNNGYLRTLPLSPDPTTFVARAEYVLQKDTMFIEKILFSRSFTDTEKDILKLTPASVLINGNPCGRTRRETGQLIVSSGHIKIRNEVEDKKRDAGSDDHRPQLLFSIIFWLIQTL